MDVEAPVRSADGVRSRALRLHERLSRATGVELPLRLWDGTTVGPEESDFRVVLNHPWSLRALLWPPTDLSAGEAYVLGWIDIEGDSIAAMAAGKRLARALPDPWRARLALAAEIFRLPKPPPRPSHRRARLSGRMHSLERDRRAIEFHYDLPQKFYESFLDERLVYSCGYFAPGDDDLNRAQRRKLDLVCRKLRLQPGQRLLDIGCGWGSLLIYAAENYGVDATGVTLSRTQAEAGSRIIAERGLSDRVRILLRDYREIDDRFDAVASVGMAEHVGPANLAAYAETTRRLLAPGGCFLCHSIVTGDAEHVRRGDEKTFITAYVFPDGGFGPVWRLVRAMQEGGFEIIDVEQLRPHYALTLRHWVANLQANREQAVAAASEQDYRIWRLYMSASSVAFAQGDLGVVQVLGRAPGGDTPLPRGREWMLTDA